MALGELEDDNPFKLWDILVKKMSEPVRSNLDEILRDYKPQSEWARKHWAAGVAEGEASKGREMLAKMYWMKFQQSPTPEIDKRLMSATVEELDRWSDLMPTAETPEELFGA